MYQRHTYNVHGHGEQITPDGMVLEQAIDPAEKTAAEYARDFPVIVAWIEGELGRSLDTLTHLALDQEMIRLPPHGMWKRYEPGKHLYITAQFRDGFRQILTLKSSELSYVPHTPDKPSEDDSAAIKTERHPRQGR